MRRELRPTELDSKAEILFQTAQNRMTQLLAAGMEEKYKNGGDVKRFTYIPLDAEEDKYDETDIDRLPLWYVTDVYKRQRLRSMSTAGRFANTMSTMLTAGLGVPRALDVTSQVVGNYLFSLGVRKVKENVERGRGIAESMAGVECFPKMLTEMVGVCLLYTSRCV